MTESRWGSFGTFPTMTSGKLADLGRRVLNRLDEWDVQLPAQNRFQRAAELLQQTAEGGALDPDDEDCLLDLGEAGRTVTEMYVATHGVSGVPEPEVAEKVREAGKGADRSEDESYHHARNIQFELYLHGLFHAGGVDIVLQEPPDLVIHYGNEQVGIAAKRVWSPNQAHKRLSDAARQIADSGLRGIIAINVERYLDGIGTSADLDEKGREFNAHVARLRGQLPYLEKKEHVIGLLAVGTAFEWDPTSAPPRLHMSNFTQMLLIANDEREETFGNYFWERFRTSVSGWMFANL